MKHATPALFLAAWILAPSPSGASGTDVCPPAGAEPEGDRILTLAEAASLLRVDAKALAEAARRREVPARQVLGRWRFSRLMLTAWVGGADVPADCVLRTEAVPLKPKEAEATRGTGPAESRTVAQVPAAPPERMERSQQPAPEETFGDDPDLASARDVSLRDQRILLRKGEATIEPSLFYSRNDASAIAIGRTETGRILVAGHETGEAFRTIVTGRYGVADDLQAFASVPWEYQMSRSEALAQFREEERSAFGDVELGLRYNLFREGAGTPGVLLSVEGRVPTRDEGSYAAGGGLSLVKAIDPVTLFAGVSYLHTFRRDDIPAAAQPSHTLSTTAGFAFAMNDRLSFSTALGATFFPSTWSGSGVPEPDESYSLRFALTSLLTESLYVEPSVVFRLNGPGSGMVLGLSLPFTFFH